MEFQDVVRKRRMVRRYADRPVDPAVVDRMLRTRCGRRAPGSARAGRSWCWTGAEDVERFWAVRQPAGRRPGEPLAERDADGAGGVVPLSSKAAYLDRYAEPDKGWTDREERRWPVPYWHIDTGMAVAADPADRRRRGARRLLLRHPARAGGGVPRGVRGARAVHADRGDHGRPPARGRRPAPPARPAAGPASRSRRSCTAAAGEVGGHAPSPPTGVRRVNRRARPRRLGSENVESTPGPP